MFLDNEFQLIGASFDEVFYYNLEVAGTVEQPPSVFTISPDEIVTVSGSFYLAF